MNGNADGVKRDLIPKELPKYKCTKIVHALKIKDIEIAPNHTPGALLIPEEEGYQPIAVDVDYLNHRLPGGDPNKAIGGYYVVYEDGYESFSPRKAFENGYERIVE